GKADASVTSRIAEAAGCNYAVYNAAIHGDKGAEATITALSRAEQSIPGGHQTLVDALHGSLPSQQAVSHAIGVSPAVYQDAVLHNNTMAAGTIAAVQNAELSLGHNAVHAASLGEPAAMRLVAEQMGVSPQVYEAAVRHGNPLAESTV